MRCLRLVVLMAWIFMALGCSAMMEDADAIREMIEDSAEMAEAKKVGKLMQQTRNGFVAMPGRRGAGEVKRILFAAFTHYGNFKIYYPKPRVEVSSDKRRASATIYFFIMRKDHPLPGLKDLYEHPRRWLEAASEKADLYQLKLEMMKEAGDWLVAEAQLQGLRGRQF